MDNVYAGLDWCNLKGLLNVKHFKVNAEKTKVRAEHEFKFLTPVLVI